MLISILAFIAAIAIASVAAWFSIIGLIALFPGSALSIAIMAGTLEVGKLVTASWLYRNWEKTNFLLKSYLVTAVIVLMVITSLGVFGYLSKSYLTHNAPLATIEVELRNYDQQLVSLTRDLNRNQQVIEQLDDAVSKLIEFSRISGPNGAIALRETQREERNLVQTDISQIQEKISDIQRKMKDIENSSIDVRSKLGPAEYIAKFIYGDGDDSVDKAVQLIILMIVLVFDPLAVLLLIAANQGISNSRSSDSGNKTASIDLARTEDLPELPATEPQVVSYDELVETLSNPKRKRTRKKKETSDTGVATESQKPEVTTDTSEEELNTSVKAKKTPNAVWIKNNKTE